MILLRFTEIAWLTTKHEYLSGLALLHIVLDTDRSEDNAHPVHREEVAAFGVKWSSTGNDSHNYPVVRPSLIALATVCSVFCLGGLLPTTSFIGACGVATTTTGN